MVAPKRLLRRQLDASMVLQKGLFQVIRGDVAPPSPLPHSAGDIFEIQKTKLQILYL